MDTLDRRDKITTKSAECETVEQARNPETSLMDNTARNKRTQGTMAREDGGDKKNFLDPIGLIRSIQRAEGNGDCFRRKQGFCDQIDCAWRIYCVEE